MSKHPDVKEHVLRAVLDYEEDGVRVTWSTKYPEETEFEWYVILQEDLRRCTTNIRRELDKLQEMEPAGGADDLSRFRDVLRSLARQGADLYEVLLTGKDQDDSPINQRVATKFRAWFEETVRDDPDVRWRIQFVHPQSAEFIVPWGLVFTPPKDGDFDSLGYVPGDFRQFWSVRHRAACSVVTPRKVGDGPEARDNVAVSAYLEMGGALLKQSVKPAGHSEDEDDPVIADDSSEAKRISRRLRRYDQFWYFWLDPEPEFQQHKAHELENILATNRLRDDRIVCVLMDGDAVVRTDRGPGWLSATLRLGRSGLIAAESDINNPALKCFGWSILRHVASQERPFMDAVMEAREQLWPHSLLYGVYCDPEMFPSPPDTRRIGVVDDILKTMDLTIYSWERS